MAKEKIDNLCFERELWNNGKKFIAGVDEVGRGPLAGPVVVAAVVMPEYPIIEGVDDSKKLSEKKREQLFEEISKIAVDYRIEFVSEKVIDEINILQATKLAMTNAINNLHVMPDITLVDAVSGLNVKCPTKPIVHGDALSYSIGAASILAKVTRDRFMKQMAEKFPDFGFEKNKGYGSAFHMAQLKKIGPCDIHRKSFLKFLENNK